MQAINPYDIIQWISAINNISSGPCYCPSFLKPIHLVTMGLAIKRDKWSDYYLQPTLEAYATRMKLWEAMNIDPPCEVSSYPESGKFVPTQRFDKDKKDVQNVADLLAKIVIKTTSKTYQSTLSICLEELVNNFFDHANATHSLPCLVAAQSWPKGKLIQVAIADAGIGIRDSLSENKELAARVLRGNSCELASQYGITSKPDHHGGYGLTLAKDLMKQSNGTYILLSGNELFSWSQGKEIKEKYDGMWKGTLLVLEWKIDFRLDSKAIYDDWPIPRGFNSDDFF